MSHTYHKELFPFNLNTFPKEFPYDSLNRPLLLIHLVSCLFLCSWQENECFQCLDVSDRSDILVADTATRSQGAELIGRRTAGAVITATPAESGAQDKDVLAGHFSV